MAVASKPQTGKQRPSGAAASLSRHLLTGAALGLYFGLFFRPLRDPNLLTVLWLSLVSALLLTLLQLRHREQRRVSRLLPYFAKSWAGFIMVLAMLEGRHLFYDWGGRLLTTLFTTIYGAGLGLLYARFRSEESL